MFVRFGFQLYRQIVNFPRGTNCASLVADLVLFCYGRDFVLSLSVAIFKLFLLTRSTLLQDTLNKKN